MICKEADIEDFVHLLVTQTPMDEKEARYICTHFSYGFPVSEILLHAGAVAKFARGMLQTIEFEQRARIAWIRGHVFAAMLSAVLKDDRVESVCLDMPESFELYPAEDFNWPVKEAREPERVKGHLYQQRRYGGDRGHPMRQRPGKGRR